MPVKCEHPGCDKWALSAGRFCAEHKPPGSQKKPATEADVSGDAEQKTVNER
ncbi:uncharacterized protein BDW70DRAFT_161444 [Aspergillus foveolatus]|uniref:uncharacterized protein n=1 Tax=Aspergillus foveolatus TaxID=210207 RepID=UPI003CCD9FA1